MSQMLTVVSPRLPAVVAGQSPTPVAVRREDVLDLLARGAQLVDVRAPVRFAASRLPGAVNVPLAQLEAASAAQLDRNGHLIVYGRDDECDLSARASWRLMSLGFSQVFRYTGGWADWVANGLPTEGPLSRTATAGSLARPDVPTCRLHDTIAQIGTSWPDQHWEACVVVNDERVVLGQLGRQDLAGDPRATAEELMQSGPATVRASADLGRLAQELRQAGAGSVPVTNSAGQLMGLLYRVDIERNLEAIAGARPRRSG